MELRHLRYFLAVASESHFGRAAAKLFVSQPALSQQIKDLESHLGAVLFERTPRGVRLTPAGEVFQPHAAATLEAARKATAAVKSFSGATSGLLRIGLPETQKAVNLVSAAIRRFADEHSSVTVETHGMPWLEQPTALLNGAIDIGFCWSGHVPRYVDGLSAQRLFDDPGRFALMATDHPLAMRKRLNFRDLIAFPFALFERRLHPFLFDHLLACIRAQVPIDVQTAAGVGSAAASVPLIVARRG